MSDRGWLRSVLVAAALVGAVFAIFAAARPAVASAKPPGWWYLLTGAGPPFFVPKPEEQEPPYDAIAPKSIHFRSLNTRLLSLTLSDCATSFL